MVVALIALFVALGGPAQAKRVIDGGSIRKGTITSKQIKNGSVAKADLSKTAVRSLTATPASSVRSAQIADGQVLAPDLGPGSVGQGQLAPGAVTASKLAADSIGGGSVANGSLQTVDIGSFTGSVNVDFGQFNDDANRCQVVETPATPAGGQPQPRRRRRRGLAAGGLVGLPDRHRQAGAGQRDPDRGLLVGADGHDARPDPGPTTFRYVTFDAP